MKTPLLLFLLLFGGCWSRRPEAPPDMRFRPAGVVRIVNMPERYLIFESTFVFSPGQELTVMHNGRKTGSIRVHPFRDRPHYAADLIEGTAKIGDIVEP